MFLKFTFILYVPVWHILIVFDIYVLSANRFTRFECSFYSELKLVFFATIALFATIFITSFLSIHV